MIPPAKRLESLDALGLSADGHDAFLSGCEGETMPVYVVAQLRFTDEASYRRYESRIAGVSANSGRRLLAADEAAIVLEGDWTMDKLVITEFDTGDVARGFLDSPAYQSISEDRRVGAETVAVLVRGL